jgi:hypothetical protein
MRQTAVDRNLNHDADSHQSESVSLISETGKDIFIIICSKKSKLHVANDSDHIHQHPRPQ